MPDGTPIWLEPPRGGHLHPAVLGLAGVETLRTELDGISPAPPSARLVGRRLESVDVGRVVCRMPASEWFLGPKGRLHAGILAYFADAPLYFAVHSSLPPNVMATTAEVSLTFLGGAPGTGGELVADGRLVYADAKNALAEVFITDGTGRLVAHGTSRCFVFPPGRLPGSQPPDGTATPAAWVEPDHDEPDPWLRPPRGAPLAPDVFSDLNGLEILERQVLGELDSPPINHLTGLRIVSVEKGSIAFALPVTPWMTNELGAAYGGAIALLAKSTTAAAVQTVAPPRTEFTALDLKVNLLRVPAVDGKDLVATGKVVHRGRLAIATTEIVDSRGKLVAIATGSTSLERPTTQKEQA